MFPIALFDTNLCVKFYSFALKNKYFIPVILFKVVGFSNFNFLPLNNWSIRILQAFSKR